MIFQHFGYIAVYPFIVEKLGFKILTKKKYLKSLMIMSLGFLKTGIRGDTFEVPDAYFQTVLLKAYNEFTFSLSV